MAAPVALVTAASQGMGAACARELAARGYRVSLLARSAEVEALARELGGGATRGSVDSADDLERFVDETIAAYGRIDAVVNNTGHPPKGALLEITDADWRTGLDMLLLNVVRMARLVTPAMRAQGGGAFVNISSFAADRARRPLSRFRPRCARRWARFCKMYADEEAKHNIRMNNVLPGFIETRAGQRRDPRDDSRRPLRPRRRDRQDGRVPAVAGCGVLTGQSLRVDGGLTRSL